MYHRREWKSQLCKCKAYLVDRTIAFTRELIYLFGALQRADFFYHALQYFSNGGTIIKFPPLESTETVY